MNQITFAIPGDISTLTGGYVYDRRLLAELRALGLAVEHLVLPASFPFPDEKDLAETRHLLGSAKAPLLMDGLAFGALPQNILTCLPHPLIALCHHPLGLEAGLIPEASARLIASEINALAHADHVIVTSPATADTLVADFAVPRSAITIAIPGTDPAPRADAYAGSSRQADAPVKLVAAGSIIPRKAYHVLVAALAGMAEANWQLEIAGSPARSPETATALDQQIAQSGLGGKIRVLGELARPQLLEVYAGADVFVMPSLYEGFGMVLTEAMACGLPLVASTGGAAAQTVPDACAIKVAPGDVAAMRAALMRIITDAPLRQQKAQASWDHGQTLARWPDTARTVALALKLAGQ